MKNHALISVLVSLFLLPFWFSFGTASMESAKIESGVYQVPRLVVLYLEGAQSTSTEAGSELVRLANQSADGRKLIITELEKFVGDHNFDNRVLGGQDWVAWVRVTELLARIQALESTEFLIRHIECSDGSSDSGGNHHPAQSALEALGKKVIPALTDALLMKTSPFRWRLILCLIDIGGSEAKVALQKVLTVEMDTDIRADIEYYLRIMDWERN